MTPVRTARALARIDDTLRAIDDTLTATEASMPDHAHDIRTAIDEPGDGKPERIPTQADLLAAAAPYDAGDAAPATYADRIPAPRVDGLSTTEQLRRQVARMTNERDEAYVELDHVEAALDRAGIHGPGSYSDRINATAETLARLRTDLAQARAEAEQALRHVAAVERERDEALANLTGVWAALNQAGLSDPVATPGDLIGRLATNRDAHLAAAEALAAQRGGLHADLARARGQVDVLTAAAERYRRTIAAQAEQLRRNGTYIAAVDDAIETLDRARAAHDTITAAPAQDAADGLTGADGTSDVDTALTDALERAETALIDSHGRFWRPAPDGGWQHPTYGTVSRQGLEQLGPTRTVLLVDIGQDDEQDDDTAAPALGSDPDRAQGQPSWNDCAAVADALTAAPGSGEIWRDHHGDITGAPLSLARVAVEALGKAGRLAEREG